MAGGVVVELDEELHFNRYRAQTLGRLWSGRLLWRDDYLAMCRRQEPECIRAGSRGKRWTNPSFEAMFGPAGPVGDVESAAGAPRWKQRALDDAVKDAQAAAGIGPKLVRLSETTTSRGGRWAPSSRGELGQAPKRCATSSAGTPPDADDPPYRRAWPG